jgi:drug/metabolite transporter (DMT)-like permease
VELGAPRARIWTALATIYVVWGSTFIALALVVRTIPPFLSMSIRHLVAGAIFLAWAWPRRGSEPVGRRELWAATLFGGALFLGGHGALAWSQQRIPAGVAALVIASIPLWVALLDRIVLGSRLSWRAVAGLIVGFAGVSVLVNPTGSGPIETAGAVVALFAAASWAAGSLYSRGAPLPAQPLLSAGLASLAGGVLLLLFATARGELTDIDTSAVSGESLGGLAYMIVVGSLIGFAAYVWLLRVAPISLVATYAYVNPVIAVVLGWAILDEELSVQVLAAGAAILVAVALIVSAGAPERARGRGLARRGAVAPGDTPEQA